MFVYSVLGVYDQDAPEHLLLENPYLYKKGRIYTSLSFWYTMADAVYQSLAVFFICQGVYYDSDIDIYHFGTVVTSACMFVMQLHAAIETRSWVHSNLKISSQKSKIFKFLLDNNSRGFFGSVHRRILFVFDTLQHALRQLLRPAEQLLDYTARDEQFQLLVDYTAVVCRCSTAKVWWDCRVAVCKLIASLQATRVQEASLQEATF